MTDKTNDRFRSLSPCFIKEETVYDEALDSALKNDDIKNIAITGIYGSGKSSVWRSYQKKRNLKDVITVSLGNYTTPEAKAEASKDLSDKKVSNIVENRIEKQIINQILAQVPANKIPLCKYEMKENKGWAIQSLMTAMLLIFILSMLIIFGQGIGQVERVASMIENLLVENTILTTESYPIVPLMGCIIPAIAYVYKTNSSHRFKVSKINFKGTEVDINDCNYQDETILDKDIREIVYIIKESGSKVVVFEDLDRFDNPTIFIKLRELNFLINAKLKGEYAVNFIYMVKDSLFATKERTKFFDFIMPVIPVANSNNADTIFTDYLNNSNLNKNQFPDDEVIANIAIYINDMRLIINVMNEYIIYSEFIELDSMTMLADNLFTLIALKNFLPKEFDELLHERGGLYELIYNSDDYREMLWDDIRNNICTDENLLNKPEEEIKSLLLGEVLSSLSKDFIDKEFTEKFGYLNKNEYEFIEYILLNSVFDDSYPFYIETFYQGKLQHNDAIFVKNILNFNKQDVLYKLKEPEKVYKRLGGLERYGCYELNKDLVEYCIKENKFKDLLSLVKIKKHRSDRWLKDFWKVLYHLEASELEEMIELLADYNEKLLIKILLEAEYDIECINKEKQMNEIFENHTGYSISSLYLMVLDELDELGELDELDELGELDELDELGELDELDELDV